ncbi:hypothetical protein DUNSADRAFT_15440 [Dunaliella salina]|uniref:Encoded protein n=1 Tax=Dunaliella salina TaxID=3046 RepID=A0ABQ7G5D0_DUNSA|nr:hypothetical protein DUNSADRAFT_15440 [Dunaliella salina]|eukprot:KAF5829822.1 hypothetical protein DUNSADRAFT_15440 [Dunaliella salina]
MRKYSSKVVNASDTLRTRVCSRGPLPSQKLRMCPHLQKNVCMSKKKSVQGKPRRHHIGLVDHQAPCQARSCRCVLIWNKVTTYKEIRPPIK